jgi:hypothetical protein
LSRSNIDATEQGGGARLGDGPPSVTCNIEDCCQEGALMEANPMPDLAFDPVEAALRQLHQTFAAEEIPDDFLDLLDQLPDGPTV